jgi:hypothetical protein
VSSAFDQISVNVVIKKSGLEVFFYIKKLIFQPIYLPKTSRKHHRNNNKPIHGLKNPKNRQKPKSTQNSKSSRAQIYFHKL